MYDVGKKGYLTGDERMLRNLDVDGDGKLDALELIPFVNRHNELRRDNEKLRKNQMILGATTIIFGVLTIVATVLAIQASKDTVVGSDGLLASKDTGKPIVTQSKGVSIVSELHSEDRFSDPENTNECVNMEDVANLYKAFGEGTDVHILTNDSSATGLNDGRITFPVTKVQGSTASINDTHVKIGDVTFDIAADNPCNKGGRKYPRGPRKLFHDHLHGRHRKLRSKPSIPSGDTKIYDAVIIGAGWAGISAAAKLLSGDIKNILILEGRDYMGGRSRTVTGFATSNPDLPFELGSEFIYTGYKNGITKIFDEGGIKSKDVTEAYALYNPSMSGQDENMGSRVEDSVGAEKKSDLWEKGFVKYLTRQNLREKDLGYDALLKKYVEEEGIEEESDQQYLRMGINGGIVIQSGGDAEDVSAQGTGSWLSDTDTVSITSVTEGGYALAIDRFDEEEKIEDKVTFNAKVVKVNYENDLVKIEYIQDGTDAKMVLAQTVLVTVPLGVL